MEMAGTATLAVGAPLTALLAALTAPEPARRPRSAAEALDRLTDILDGWPLETPALVPGSEEPVEVFEQIGPLPHGWGPTGPIAEAETATLALMGDRATATTMRIERRATVRIEPAATMRIEPGATVRIDGAGGGADRLWSPGPEAAPASGPVSSPDYGQPRIPLPGNEFAARQPHLPLSGGAFGVRSHCTRRSRQRRARHRPPPPHPPHHHSAAGVPRRHGRAAGLAAAGGGS